MKTLQHYINGRFVSPVKGAGLFDVVNPANEEVVAQIEMGTADDANLAVEAAALAFEAYAATTLDERLALMEKLLAVYERRYGEMAEAITTEMGAPKDFSFNSQAECGSGHIKETLKAAREFDWEAKSGKRGSVVREPVGVCALITPWNWPMNQVAAKVVPALLSGCTVVLKPSEQSPLSAQIWAECVHEAGYPAGVFNMVHGTGPAVGSALSVHPDVDMVSFTRSPRPPPTPSSVSPRNSAASRPTSSSPTTTWRP